MDQASPHRAAVADLEVADQGHGRSQQGIPCCETRVPFESALARQRPDAETAVAAVGDPVQTGNAVQVDDGRGTRQPQVHERHEALAAGQDLPVLAVLVEHAERLVEGLRTVVGKGRGFHGDGRCLVGAQPDFLCAARFPQPQSIARIYQQRKAVLQEGRVAGGSLAASLSYPYAGQGLTQTSETEAQAQIDGGFSPLAVFQSKGKDLLFRNSCG